MSRLIATDKPKIHISDLIDIERLRVLFESYSETTGMVTALLDLEGNVLIATNWQDSCTRFHRQNEMTSKRCVESDTALASSLEKGKSYTAYECRNGLVDVATPIVIEGEHLANFFTGQFFYQTPDLDKFSRQAEEAGFDQSEYIDAIKRVPVYDKQTITKHMEFLVRIAETVAEMGATNLRIASLNDELERQKQELEIKVTERTAELESEKEKALKLSSVKSQFLANMSHEIRTPMNGIIGLTNLLIESGLEGKQLEWAQGVKSSSDSLLSIINDILDISKIESGKLNLESVSFDLLQLLDQIEAVLRISAKNKAISFDLDRSQLGHRHFIGDPVRIRQVITNLANNAIKFTEDGSVSINIEAESSPEDTHWQLRFAVSDTGIGVNPSSQADLFTRFSQADSSTTRRFGGTGLGLNICKQLVNLMKGEIGYEPKPDKGSIFWFSINLPLDNNDEIQVTQPQQSTRDMDLTGVNVLLVEDVKINQLVAIDILDQLGIRTDIAENGREAVDKVKGAEYDVILMDCHMPVMDGFEATSLIRQMPGYESLPIIALTAGVLPEEQLKCMNSGMNTVVTKPFESSDLSKAIISLLQH